MKTKMTGLKALLAAVIMLVTTTTVVSAQTLAGAPPVRNVEQYNLEASVALKGYDPVSYFPEGGGRPLSGLKNLRLDYMGVTYFFATAANFDLFVTNPDKYEPTYGGWCAFAMASGSKVDIQPTIFTVAGNRLHFFVSERAKRNFDADIVGFETRADEFWKQISGESPRK